MTLQAGSQLRMTGTGELLTIWSAAHLTGCYWAHVKDGSDRPPLVLVRVRQGKADAHPTVTLAEEA